VEKRRRREGRRLVREGEFEWREVRREER